MKCNGAVTVVFVVCAAMLSAAEYPKDMYVNRPDLVVYVPRKPITHQWKKGCDDIVSKRQRGDSYNDHFQVLDDRARGLLYAFWTQATWEGCTDMHIAFSKSADNGRSWTEPVVLAGSEDRANPKLTASWQQPMLSASGRLYCLWNQQIGWGGQLCGWLYGIWSDDGGETWSAPKKIDFAERMDLDQPNRTLPPAWCNWQRPLRLGEGGRYFVGCSRHGKAPYDLRGGTKVEFWQFENIDENPEVGDIRISYFATNRLSLSADRVRAPEGVRLFSPKTEGAVVEEAGVVKLPDGRLFALMRSSVGYPVWSQSRDGGRTWSAPKVLVDCSGRAVPHPRSPCPIYDWKGPEAASGLYFALVHNAFDLNGETAYQKRGPLYLIAGRFDPKGDQPIRFGSPKLFAPRSEANSFYTSYTAVNGEGVLWFNDRKYYLLGRKIGSEWFEDSL